MLELIKAEFEKWHRFPVTDDMDIQTEVAWENWQAAWDACNAAIGADIDCRLCARYTTNTGGCMATAQCIGGNQFEATALRQYWIDVSPDSIAEHLGSILADGSNCCPLCGNRSVHEHTPAEIVIYRNGVKYGRRLVPNDSNEGPALATVPLD